MTDAGTSELYYFCGSNAKVTSGVENQTATCTISDSTEIIDQISDHGAFGLENNVSDVLISSYAVLDSSTAYAASQYGGIFFTHDTLSYIAPNGSSFDDAVIASCQQNTGNYTTVDQCNDNKGIGYIIK